MRLSNIDDYRFAPTSALSADAPVQTVKNGDFSTGNFHHWTTFTTQFGTLGYPNFPKVTSFDVTGSGAQEAAEFQVGQVGDVGSEEGGGIMQTITTTQGELDFSANIAAFTSKQVNLEGGTFSVLLDGVTEDTVTIGVMAKHTIQRGELSFDATVTAGSHTLEILITRDFTGGTRRGNTPVRICDEHFGDAGFRFTLADRRSSRLHHRRRRAWGRIGIAVRRRRDPCRSPDDDRPAPWRGGVMAEIGGLSS